MRQKSDGCVVTSSKGADHAFAEIPKDQIKTRRHVFNTSRHKARKSTGADARPQGATVEELAKATGWQKHTVRGAIAGAMKKKLRQRVKVINEGERRSYTIARRQH